MRERKDAEGKKRDKGGQRNQYVASMEQVYLAYDNLEVSRPKQMVNPLATPIKLNPGSD